MNVLYDISVLGMGHVNPKSRTGVFRVIENVAGNLAIDPRCNLTFCGSQDRQNLRDCIAYLDSSSELKNVPLSLPPDFNLLMDQADKKAALIHEIFSDKSLSAPAKLSLKFRVKWASVIESFNHVDPALLINQADEASSDIYHSPYHPLPEKVKTGNYKSQFLTCYDLLPILYPQFFQEGSNEHMISILKSLDRKTWILCISESTRTDLLNHMGEKLSPERVIVTPLAASEIFYQSLDVATNQQVRRKHHIPETPYILSLCTFEPRKNIDQVIKAFATLISQENLKDLNLVLVGVKGWKFDKIFDEISNSEELKSRIIITGFVADQDLAAIYSDAMYFIYPSFYEGFGLPPLEAMQCGIPVITSNTSSLPEVVGDAGIMVSPTDLDQLCNEMLTLYKDADLRARMSKQSLQRAATFSWTRCADETVAAYQASLTQ